MISRPLAFSSRKWRLNCSMKMNLARERSSDEEPDGTWSEMTV
jgi:hypothetical protein